MRDSPQLQFQTPQRDPNLPNRRLKSTPDVKSNSKKVVRKILSPELTNVLEESPKEVSDQNSPTDSDENLAASVDPVIEQSPGTFVMLDPDSPASTVTSVMNVALDDASEVDLSKIESIEAEMVVKCLKEARIRLLKSEDIGGPHKKLLDALIDITLKEYCGGVGGEKKWLGSLLSSKPDLVLLGCMVVIFVVFVIWSFNVRAANLFPEPLPT